MTLDKIAAVKVDGAEMKDVALIQVTINFTEPDNTVENKATIHSIVNGKPRIITCVLEAIEIG